MDTATGVVFALLVFVAIVTALTGCGYVHEHSRDASVAPHTHDLATKTVPTPVTPATDTKAHRRLDALEDKVKALGAAIEDAL